MRKNIVLSILTCFLVTACNTKGSSESSFSESSSLSESEATSITEEETSESEITSEERYKKIDIYAVNDFHGAVEETYNRLGLTKFASYFKERGEEPNTLLIDSGDTWQGSIYSNLNYGAMVNDVYNYIKFDARTVGNHDFDWGLDKIKANVKRSYNGYTTPTLAANVYDYNFETKTTGLTQQSDIGQTSVSYTLENGLKVGIIGTIGAKQITSITSSYVKDIAFINPVDVIKNEAQKLRNDGCDIVISSCHTGQEDLLGNGLSSYVDLSLCAHTHRVQYVSEDNVLFAQYGAYGQSFGHITLNYDTVLNKVVSTKHKVLYASDLNDTKEDKGVIDIIDSYRDDFDKLANETIASNVSGAFYSSEQLPNLMCRAVYDYCKDLGYDIELSYINNARTSLYTDSWDYADIYQAFPFDNEIYIFEISGKDFNREVQNYNSICRDIDSMIKDIPYDDAKYLVATIDYLLFHTNENRDYDYFANSDVELSTRVSLNYRELLRDWMIKNDYHDGKLLSADDFSNDLPEYNRSYYNYHEY